MGVGIGVVVVVIIIAASMLAARAAAGATTGSGTRSGSGDDISNKFEGSRCTGCLQEYVEWQSESNGCCSSGGTTLPLPRPNPSLAMFMFMFVFMPICGKIWPLPPQEFLGVTWCWCGRWNVDADATAAISFFLFLNTKDERVGVLLGWLSLMRIIIINVLRSGWLGLSGVRLPSLVVQNVIRKIYVLKRLRPFLLCPLPSHRQICLFFSIACFDCSAALCPNENDVPLLLIVVAAVWGYWVASNSPPPRLLLFSEGTEYGTHIHYDR